MKKFVVGAAVIFSTLGFPVVATGQAVEILGAMSYEGSGSHGLNQSQTDSTTGLNSEALEIKIVPFDRELAPGSVVVRTHARELYYVLPDGQAMLYPVGVGREGFTWSGEDTISKKVEWPDWHPPEEMIARESDRGQIIPAYMPGGPNNPLGARALYIGSTLFRIHGTTQPSSIGRAVSSGCIRMLNDHVIDLFGRVEVGAKVIVE